ncbi:NmrA family protein [Fibrella aestuarina BUZ 2]|uniref:NmrA family protein n=1 Tax=Fibrella aestuarina BUZ 2 TaxID=1166018 RepID=I0KEZ2_9BACT|nr:NAD(P)H-binding protein [Fibrella aestuarina]CCH02695.1 NmrA family protein [Fibrella aestuarina BUZ 2]
MNVIVTGSLGHISKPLTQELIEKGHRVTVVSSSPDRKPDIDALGATAAIGTIDDVDFLTATFTGADAVYCMIPPAHFAEPDRRAHYSQIASNYAHAIRQAGVPRVIHLSSFGADLDQGTGIILGAYDAEHILNELTGVAITHMRPTYFYYNLNAFIGMIKQTGRIMANYGGDDVIPMVAPVDIAAAIADELGTPATDSRKIRYVGSDERTGHEVARVLGAAIGQPDLAWVLISDEQVQQGMEANGLPSILATGLVEMYTSLRSGAMATDYYRHKPALGSVKLEAFASEFATAFNQPS